jgi:hypothetical protein
MVIMTLLLRVLLLLAAATRRVRAIEVKVPAESHGKTAQLSCDGWYGIVVGKATFGASCFAADRHDGCPVAVCKANCPGCNTVSCPAVPGTEAGKCASPDVTSLVRSACDGQGLCAFPICIIDHATPGNPVGDPAAQGGKLCMDPPTKWPLGDPAFGCTKEFVVEYSCTAWGWDFIALLVGAKFTGLAQNLAQLQASHRDFQSNCWGQLVNYGP